MRYKKALIIVLLIAFLFRFAPIAIYGMPISYDEPYHFRTAQSVLEQQNIPKIDETLGGRANIYPPLESVLLVELNLLTGIPLSVFAMILLPLASALVALSVFVLVKRLRNEKWAIIASLLIAVNTGLIAFAFDSPENIVFFLLPGILLLFYLKKNWLAAGLFAICLLFNYFIIIVSVIPLLVAYRKQMKTIATIAIGLIAVIAFYFFTNGAAIIQSQHLMSGVEFILSNFGGILPVLFIVAFALSLPLIFGSWKKMDSNESVFWFVLLLIGLLSILSIFFTHFFRPWEQIKFMSFSAVMLIGLVKVNFFKKYAILLGTIFIIFSLLLSFHVMFPRITKLDENAISYLQQIEEKNPGMVLAEPSFSEHINIRTNLNDKLITSLYFENLPEKNFFNEGLLFLTSQGTENQNNFLQESGLRYIMLNFEGFEFVAVHLDVNL